jgi:hypothetical protein
VIGPFTRFLRGFDSAFSDSQRVTITTDDEWRLLLPRIESHRPPILSTPDFSRQTVLLVALGGRNSESQWIVIDSLRAVDGVLRAFVRKPQYRHECLVASSVSTPVDLIVADTAGLRVEFVEGADDWVDCFYREPSR